MDNKNDLGKGKVGTEYLYPKGTNIDLGNLLYIYYRFPNKENVKIMYPQNLFIADDGHKVVDSYGGEHFIPFGFIHIKSKLKEEFVSGEKQLNG